MTAQDKLIILFIHGAWHIPLHYRDLLDRLRSGGYGILAPTLAITGYDDSIDGKTHVDATAQVRQLLIPYLDQGRKVVVVSHSYGGAVATQVSAGLTLEERVAQGLRGGVVGLVYIAAIISPEDGRAPPERPFPYPAGWTDYKKLPLPHDLARALLYHDVEEPRVNEALRLLVWQSESASTPDGLCVVSDIPVPKTYVVCKNDKIVMPKDQYRFAEAAGATVVELECGHSPFLIEKETAALVDIITKTATALK
ncbi:Alpha/beta hydrolase fold-1 [Daldinia sp. FL1419]|nr:Alpha/beta hydrolase fold-1 [Daldinia sp. FL1419]